MRYERKYKIEHLSLDVVHQIIRMHPFSFRKTYPDRQVNNIYYDTPELTCYTDNTAGVAERSKYRVRWYGPIKEEILQPIFEVKFKSHLLGSKKSRSLSDAPIRELSKLHQQVNRLQEGVSSLIPVLVNTYHRSYYESYDKHFRITIDSQLRYNPYATQKILQFDQYHLSEAGTIVELKYEDIYDNLADEVMQYLPFRNTKNSKYVSGLSLVSGG